MKKVLWLASGFLVSLGLLVLPAYSQWSGPTVIDIDPAEDVGLHSSIVADDVGDRHISYYDQGNGNLKYAKWDGAWTIEVVDSVGDVGQFTSLAVDASGKVHISYFDLTNEDLKYANNIGGDWTALQVDTTSDAGRYSSIALDDSMRPHISYQQEVSFLSRVLRYAWFDRNWILETVDDAGGSGWTGAYTSIVLDSQNRPHISYQNQASADLMHAFRDVTWSIETVDNADIGVGQYSSIALNSNGDPGISYLHVPSFTQMFLRYASYNGSWTIETIDNRDRCGLYTSLAYNLADEAMISYNGAATGDLRFAWDSAGTWLLETPDSGGNVGEYTSITADIAGCPMISYYDVDSLSLKFVDRGCAIIGVEEEQFHLHEPALWLKSSFPNPALGRARIAYQLPASGRVDLTVYSIGGRRVRTLVDDTQEAGRGWVEWDGKDDSGHALPSGVYLYRLKYEGQVLCKSLVLLR